MSLGANFSWVLRSHRPSMTQARRLAVPARPCVSTLLVRPSLALLLMLAAVTTAAAQDPGRSEALAAAAENLSTGRYEEAAKLYESGAPAPGTAESYNHAISLLGAGKAIEGETMLKETIVAARSARIAADGAFNLGRSLYERSKSVEDDSARLDLLRQSAGAFRACIDAAPTDRDGARALEIVRREIKAVRDRMDERQKQQQQQKQEEQQKADQQRKQEQQQLADELNKLADQQNRAEQQTAQNQGQARRNPDQQQQAQRESQSEQQAVSDRTRSASRDLEKQSAADQRRSQTPSEPMQNAQRAMNQAREAQQKAEESLSKGDFETARQQQQAAAEKLREAARNVEPSANQPTESEPGQPEERGQDNQEPQSSAQPAQPREARPAKEQPKGDRLADQLLDREEEYRKARARAQRSTQGAPTPVERDW